jgi:hypothetical protein
MTLRDAFCLVWWMTNIMHFFDPGPVCVWQDFFAVVQHCSLGSPVFSLKALMAYPDVKLVASFVYTHQFQEAVPTQLRV